MAVAPLAAFQPCRSGHPVHIQVAQVRTAGVSAAGAFGFPLSQSRCNVAFSPYPLGLRSPCGVTGLKGPELETAPTALKWRDSRTQTCTISATTTGALLIELRPCKDGRTYTFYLQIVRHSTIELCPTGNPVPTQTDARLRRNPAETGQ